MKEDKDTRVVEVFTGSPWEAEFIKGIARKQWNRIYPERRRWARSFGTLLHGQEIAVLVNEDDYENAMEIVRNREKANE